MLLRYDLDKLGWYEFERLCQVLLKERLGLGLEAWGGSGDWGRDAYYESLLKYPTKDESEGPFLFQCKFVNGANAAGAKCDDLILGAVGKECKSIAKKLPRHLPQANPVAKSNRWKTTPQYYTFMTNASLSPNLHNAVEKKILEVLPDCKFIKQDGTNLCCWLDATNGIAKKFPQILGLNDLDTLLSSIVHRDVITRSRSAIEEAKDVSKVFVPTESYSKAIEVLFRNKYVVLEGPPEVGKTAIGRMIALSLMTEGWEVHECSGPQDVLSMYNNSDHTIKQIFISDDSFGRTEYSPDRVNHWQNELPYVLRKLNLNRLLILTSRKHLLEMAKEKLDIPGAHDFFPSTGEVLVDVSVLTKEEKALMVYRHIKNANLSEVLKSHLKKLPNTIIENNNFTPERIRFMVKEFKKLEPIFTTSQSHDIKTVQSIIHYCLRNPSDRMRKTYRELPPPHRWFMISMLISEKTVAPFLYRRNDHEKINTIYAKLCPPEEFSDFDNVKNQLTEAFIKINSFNETILITWVHPSCGDMVSSELSRNAKDRIHYINNCEIMGLKYLLSIGGGSKGEINMPFLKTDYDWELFETRLNKLENYELTIIEDMVSTVAYINKTAKYSHIKARLERIIYDVLLPKYITYYNINGWELDSFFIGFELQKRSLHKETNRSPNIEYEKIWLDIADNVILDLSSDDMIWENCYHLDKLNKLNAFLYEKDPIFFEKEHITKKYKEVIDECIQRGDQEIHSISDPNEKDIEEWADGYKDASKSFLRLSELTVNLYDKDSLSVIAKSFQEITEDYQEQIPFEPDYGDDDNYRYERGGSESSFSVDRLFEDL